MSINNDAGQDCGCGGHCGPKSSVSRRGFLKVTGAGLMMAGALNGFVRKARAGDTLPHLVPAEKKLSRGWLKSLYERGAPAVYRGQELDTIGMPCGGIGTGQLYLCGDGTLGIWEVFNHHEFRGVGHTSFAHRIPEKSVKQSFVLMARQGVQTEERTLDKQGFDDVSFRGEYPIATIEYKDSSFPLKAKMEAYSPYIPLNAADSALPATMFDITITNTSDKQVVAAVRGVLENAVCMNTAGEVPGLRRTRVARDAEGRSFIVHTAEDAPASAEPPREAILLADFEADSYGDWKAEGEAFGNKPAQGTYPTYQQTVTGFKGEGLVNTFNGGDEARGRLTSPEFTINRKFLNFLVGGGNRSAVTCVNLVVDGQVVRSASGENREELTQKCWNVAEYDGKQAQIVIVDDEPGPWGHINADHFELSDVRADGLGGPVNALPDWGTMVLATPQAVAGFSINAGPTAQFKARDDVSDPFPAKPVGEIEAGWAVLEPGKEYTFTFVIAWHFPNSKEGHEYQSRFPDAPSVAIYMFQNQARLGRDTRKWRDAYYDSTLPYWLLDRLHSTASYLATGTCQWWKNGRFYAYEGVVCCEGTCTHVWNYAQLPARLFPELERSARELQDFNADGGGFHPDTGLVGFRSNDAYAADGQCGTILKAYREHLVSPNDQFLRRNWAAVKKALEFSMTQDANDDGLIENTQHNTYDINFEGPNTFVGSLYLAALRAGEEMAKAMGDTDFAARCRKTFESGRDLTMKRLFDGEYFTQEVDLTKHPKHQYGLGCLSDQLFGQAWAHQVGLGYIYPKEAVQSALKAVWKYNWAPDITEYNESHKPDRWFVDAGDAGLFVATWPKSDYLPEGVLYRNEVWTGIEYQVAAHLIWEGMLEQALIACRAVHDRYHPLKRNPYNEVECGDHYARAFASWGVYLALAGFEYNGPTAAMKFNPQLAAANFKAAFTAAEGWGTYAREVRADGQSDGLLIHWGQVRLREFTVPVNTGFEEKAVTVEVGGKPVKFEALKSPGFVTIRFTEEAALKERDTLEVRLG